MIFSIFHKKSNYERISEFNLNGYTDYHIFLQCLEWILQNKYDLAYRLCCRYNAEKPIPPGMNYNWTEKFHNGISDTLEKSVRSIMAETVDYYISASAIYLCFSGLSLWNVSCFLSRFRPEYNFNVIQDELKYISSLLSDDIVFDSYKISDVKKYRFLASLDEKTCPICGELDGQLFLIDEKQIGINCPPMHKGCRCTTISGDYDVFKESAQRFARDSNGRGIKVPASMTWSTWKKQYK